MRSINRRGFLRRLGTITGAVAGAAAMGVVSTALPAHAMLREEVVTPLVGAVVEPAGLRPARASLISCVTQTPFDHAEIVRIAPIAAADLPAWSEPKTWTNHEMISAAQFNHEIRDKITYLVQVLRLQGLIS